MNTDRIRLFREVISSCGYIWFEKQSKNWLESKRRLCRRTLWKFERGGVCAMRHDLFQWEKRRLPLWLETRNWNCRLDCHCTHHFNEWMRFTALYIVFLISKVKLCCQFTFIRRTISTNSVCEISEVRWGNMTTSAIQYANIVVYAITFTLGLLGHTCSLLIFCQRELRSTSTTLLFIGTTISDLLFLFFLLYDFVPINLGLAQLTPYYVQHCQFRTFIFNFVQTTSAWLLVCVSLDRFIRARLPHRTRRWCTKRNAIMAHVLIILCAAALNSHVFSPLYFPRLGSTRFVCGLTREVLTPYIYFYFYVWTATQICINILIPTLLMIVCLFVIYRSVLNAATIRHSSHIQRQMLLLMLWKVLLFLACTLPYGISRMFLTYSVDPVELEKSSTFSIFTTILHMLLNTNYSVAFYVHCLSSTLFRQTFIKIATGCLRRLRRRQNAVQPALRRTVSVRRTTQETLGNVHVLPVKNAAWTENKVTWILSSCQSAWVVKKQRRIRSSPAR